MLSAMSDSSPTGGPYGAPSQLDTSGQPGPSGGPFAGPSAQPSPAGPGRSLFAGVLMGFANLVPGISGGTMILAVGLYDRFIEAVSDVTRLRFKPRSVALLAWIAVGALVAVVTLSGLLVDLVVEHRWVMYSLFIGMTLGGAPTLWRAMQPLRPSVVVAAVLGLAAMAAFAYWMTGTYLGIGFGVLVLVGAIAASSMILPGISGSYLLLLFGLYETIIGALRVSAWREDWEASLRIVGPVVMGAGLGIALLSSALRVFLERKPQVAHGMLLGLLVGSILGLWPFQDPVDKELARKDVRKATVMALADVSGEVIRSEHGDAFTDERLAELRARYAGKSASDLKILGGELQRFSPSAGQVGGALGLFLLGLAVTHWLGRRGGEDPLA